jgi:AcrR family transcriptional regulator
MPKVTEQYLDARREHILDAARRCFLRNGFHATSMQDLFAEAGLSSGAVYRYFASKDDMILAIAESNLREIVAMIAAVAQQPQGGSVGAGLAAATELVRAKHEQDGLAGLGVQVWAEALRNPPLGDQIRRLLTQERAEVTELVRQHQASGDLPAQTPAADLASTFLCIMPGYILQLALLGPDSVRGVPEALRALWP